MFLHSNSFHLLWELTCSSKADRRQVLRNLKNTHNDVHVWIHDLAKKHRFKGVLSALRDKKKRFVKVMLAELAQGKKKKGKAHLMKELEKKMQQKTPR
ncbi:MAG: hypothetical protein RLY57_718 [Candidatus Parcubacteria bacterium]|jgi:hypothetical protein